MAAVDSPYDSPRIGNHEKVIQPRQGTNKLVKRSAKISAIRSYLFRP